MAILTNWKPIIWVGLLVVVSSCGRGIVEFAVFNDEKENIINGEIEVCGESFDISGLKSGGMRSFSTNVCSDSAYVVLASFSSGHVIRNKQLGYITSGIKSLKDKISFKNGDVLIERKQVVV